MPEKKSKPFPKVSLPVAAKPVTGQAAIPETITPETVTPRMAETATGSRSSEPDWDNIFVTDEPGQARADDTVEPVSKPTDDKPVLMSEETFFGYFKLGFALPNQLLNNRPPFPLDSLPISPDEEPEARDAANAIYKIILETEGLHWLLTKDSPWIQKALPIILFFGNKTMAVAGEMRAKRAQEINPEARPDPAPDPARATPPNQQAQTPQHADLASGAAGAV